MLSCKVCGAALSDVIVDCASCGTRNPNVTMKKFEVFIEDSLLLAVNRWSVALGETVQNFIARALEDRVKALWLSRDKK